MSRTCRLGLAATPPERVARQRVAGAVAVAVLACGLAACAPVSANTAADAEGEDVAAVEAVGFGAWSPDVDCAACHLGNAASLTQTGTLGAVHESSGASMDCIACHADEVALSTLHASYTDEGAKVPARLRKTTVSDGSCAASGCHDVAELVQKTESSAVLTDSDGTVRNPHAMVSDPLHGLGGETGADIQCVSCHEVHKEGGADRQAMAETARDQCLSCHHADVYECGTCHE